MEFLIGLLFGIIAGFVCSFTLFRIDLKKQLDSARDEWFASLYPQSPEEAGIIDGGTYDEEEPYDKTRDFLKQLEEAMGPEDDEAI